LDSDIRLYFDENVETAVADQMRTRGIECITVRDLDLLGETDESHLHRAAEMGYVLCTYDADYPRLHAGGFSHAGIIFARERSTSIGDWVRGLELICGAMTASEMKDHIEYL
jgi:hypothetical protein